MAYLSSNHWKYLYLSTSLAFLFLSACSQEEITGSIDLVSDMVMHVMKEARHMEASKKLFQSENPRLQREGFEYLTTEFEAGSFYSGGKLGWAYQLGLGVDSDLEEALTLYEAAASRGGTYWQYLLSHAYENGYLGLQKDKEKSIYWREFEPKIHIAEYDCWVVSYYQMGIFPANPPLQSKHDELCKIVEDTVH